MKKYIKKSVLPFVFFAWALTSCDQERDVAEIVSPSDYPVATVNFASSDVATRTNEAEETEYIYTVEIDKMLKFPVTISARQVGGTASGDDYTVTDAVIAPFTTEAQLIVHINSDIEPEEEETLELEIGAFAIASKDLLHTSTTFPENLNLTIGNYVSGDLEMTFAWDADVTIKDDFDHDVVLHTCDSVDFDVYIADAEGFDITNPVANPAVDAATGDCPEEMIFSGLPDGSYVIYANLYSNDLADEGADTPMPITATFTREGAFLDKVYVQDPSQVLSSDTSGVVNTYVAEVTISSGIYTIKGFDGSEIASGRVSGSED